MPVEELFNYIFQNNVTCPSCFETDIRIKVTRDKEGEVDVDVRCAQCHRMADKDDFCTEM